MGQTLLYISIGAALGACLRYLTGIAFNGLFEHFNIGTLVANLAGCYLMGFVLAGVINSLGDSHSARAFFVVGFLGSLTTFSAFSGEVISLFNQSRWALGTFTLGIHVIGSLLMTVLGMMSASLLR